MPKLKHFEGKLQEVTLARGYCLSFVAGSPSSFLSFSFRFCKESARNIKKKTELSRDEFLKKFSADIAWDSKWNRWRYEFWL